LKIDTLQIGMPKTYPTRAGATRRTSIYRTPAIGPVFLYTDHLDQDLPSNLKSHGGPEKAVNVYPGEHYAYWQDTLNLPLPPAGSFGENFTTSGWLEENACIGDICQAGDAVVQISQPRRPCATLAWRWDIPDFIDIVNEAGRTGWYLRVLQEGEVKSGDEIILKERLFPEWTIARANAIVLHPRANEMDTRNLAACPALSPAWVATLNKLLG
jgi:MOSC domain-containing protein YiiM